MLCEREIARKDHRRIDMALKLAHFPAVKELNGFDFEAQALIGRELLGHFAQKRFMATKGIEQAAVRDDIEQAAVVGLAVNFHQQLTQIAQQRHADGIVVHESAGARVRQDFLCARK